MNGDGRTGAAGTPPPPVSGAGRWRRRAAIAAAVLAGLAVVLRVALPYAIERAVPVAAARFGFAASIDNVDLALLRGHVTLEGVRATPLAGSAGAPELLSLGRVFVNVDWLPLLRGEIEVAELLLEKPSLSLVRAADGYIELPTLPAATEPEEPTEPKPSSPLAIRVKSLSIRDSAFRLVDGAGGADLVDFALSELGFTELSLLGAKLGLDGIRISEPRLRVRREVLSTKAGARGQVAAVEAAPPVGAAATPDLHIDDLEIERAEFSVLTDAEPVSIALRLKTSGVTLAPDTPFPIDFGLEAREGSVVLKGRLGLNPLVWDGQIVWQRLAAPMFVRAALPDLIPWIESCSASGALDVKLEPKSLRASGTLGVEDFAVRDPEQELALGWKRLAIELRELKLPLAGATEPVEVALGTISLDGPEARYVLPNSAFQRLRGSAGVAPESAGTESVPAEPTHDAGPPAPEPRITLDKFELRGGSVEFVDRSGKAPYRGRVRDLSVDVAGFALPERTLQSVRVRGIAPDSAPFDLRAALPGAQGTLSLKLDGLPLAQFSPYAASAADLRIPKGELSLDTKGTFTSAGAAGKVDSKIRLHQLSIQSGPNAVSVGGMPIDLALALLRDPKGDISLPIPLEYGEQGTSAALGTILLGALQAAITGAVTSPIKALGFLLPESGSKTISVAEVAFAPGSASPPADAAARLVPLVELLHQRPGLALTLHGQAGPEDRLALAEQILIERIVADRGLPELADSGFLARRRVAAALAERGRGEPGALEPDDQTLLARYREATQVPAERYADLARRRADALRTLLIAGHALPPARIVASASAQPLAPGVTPELRVADAQEDPPSATP